MLFEHHSKMRVKSKALINRKEIQMKDMKLVKLVSFIIANKPQQIYFKLSGSASRTIKDDNNPNNTLENLAFTLYDPAQTIIYVPTP